MIYRDNDPSKSLEKMSVCTLENSWPGLKYSGRNMERTKIIFFYPV